jgi:hypothetical protein
MSAMWSAQGRDIPEEGKLMRLLVKLEHGACVPCFMQLSGLPSQRVDATLDTLGTQIKIYADDDSCPECQRRGHVVRLFDMRTA